jgi:hypothetical protein
MVWNANVCSKLGAWAVEFMVTIPRALGSQTD